MTNSNLNENRRVTTFSTSLACRTLVAMAKPARENTTLFEVESLMENVAKLMEEKDNVLEGLHLTGGEASKVSNVRKEFAIASKKLQDASKLMRTVSGKVTAKFKRERKRKMGDALRHDRNAKKKSHILREIQYFGENTRKKESIKKKRWATRELKMLSNSTDNVVSPDQTISRSIERGGTLKAPRPNDGYIYTPLPLRAPFREGINFLSSCLLFNS